MFPGETLPWEIELLQNELLLDFPMLNILLLVYKQHDKIID